MAQLAALLKSPVKEVPFQKIDVNWEHLYNELASRMDTLRRDAENYRLLRSSVKEHNGRKQQGCSWPIGGNKADMLFLYWCTPEQLDALFEEMKRK